MHNIFTCSRNVAVESSKMANENPVNLHTAVSTGNIEVLKSVLRTGEGIGDVNRRNAKQQTPLFCVSAAGYLDAARLLIQSGAKVNARSRKQFCPLHIAASNGHLPILIELISAGADLERKTIRKMTPLNLAAKHGHIDCVVKLIDHGADIFGSGGDMFGRTPLHWAIKGGYGNIVELLIEAGADVAVADNFGKTPFMQAVKSGQPDIVSQLLRIPNVDPTVANRQLLEPIHVAATRQRIRCLEILLRQTTEGGAGLSPDRVTIPEQNKTPLMLAAAHGHQNVVKFLLANGANGNRQDVFGMTALDYVVTGRMMVHATKNPQWKNCVVILVRDGNVNPNILNDCPFSWNDEDGIGGSVYRNFVEMAFRAGFDDLVRVGVVAGAMPRNLVKLFRMRTLELPEYARRLSGTLDWLRMYFKSPRPLRELARFTVRTELGSRCFLERLEQLKLAPSLKQFLMFPELNETPKISRDLLAYFGTDSDENEDDNDDGEANTTAGESNTEEEMEPSVFDSDLYGGNGPYDTE